MYKVVLSKKYKKSLKKIKGSRKYNISEIDSIIRILASGKNLNAKYKDHALNGTMKHFRECHIKSDLLLIYQIKNNELILLLIDIGSHSQLF